MNVEKSCAMVDKDSTAPVAFVLRFSPSSRGEAAANRRLVLIDRHASAGRNIVSLEDLHFLWDWFAGFGPGRSTFGFGKLAGRAQRMDALADPRNHGQKTRWSRVSGRRCRIMRKRISSGLWLV